MKYVIDIDHIPYLHVDEKDNMSPHLYKAKGFNSLVFDQNGLDKLEKYEDADALQIEMDAKSKGYDSGFKKGYDNGAGDAWAFARAMFYPKVIGGTDAENFNECYHGKSAEEVLKDMSYQEAKEKYEAWKKQKEAIHVGDEVIPIDTNYDTMIVTRIWTDDYWSDCIDTMGLDGCICSFHTSNVKKTGRHFDEVEELLKKIKEDK